MAAGNQNSLTGYGYAAPSYQVGLGPSYGQGVPADVYVSPASGSTITPLTSTLVVTNGSTISALTVQFPSQVGEGARLRIFCSAAVTTLTLTAGTNITGATDTIVGGVTALTANTPVEYVYKLAPATNAAAGSANAYSWYRVN